MAKSTFGTPAARSKFPKLQIGMGRTVVEKLIGGPDDSLDTLISISVDRKATGKRS